MKKIALQNLFENSTKKIKLLGLTLVSVFAIALFSYYIAVIIPSKAIAFSGSGAGSPDDPYRIQTCEQLQEINDAPSSNFVLMNNIDCSDTATWNNGKGFDPIKDFSSTFDGRNFEIQNLYINRPDELSVGLFSTTINSAVLKNVKLTKDPQYSERIDIQGGLKVGALIGRGIGFSITHVHTELSVKAIQQAENNPDSLAEVGGLVGYSNFQYYQWNSSTGKVSLNLEPSGIASISLGGLIGSQENFDAGTTFIQDSYSTAIIQGPDSNSTIGGVCGGLIGQYTSPNPQTVSLSRTYSSGDVNCQSAPDNPNGAPNAGGLIGSLLYRGDADKFPQINNSFSISEINAVSKRGLIFGFYKGPIDDGKQSVENLTGNYYDSFKTGAAYCIEATISEPGKCEAIDGNSDPNFFTQNSSPVYNDWGINESLGDYWILEDGSLPVIEDEAVMASPATNLNVIRDGSNHIVSWTNPVSDLTRTLGITGYKVQYRNITSSNDEPWVTVDEKFSNTEQMATISGLEIPGKYQFRVFALYLHPVGNNVELTGLFSDALEVATGMPEVAPSNLVSIPKSQSAEIRWDEVTEVDRYAARYRKVGTDTWQAINSNLVNNNDRYALIYDIEPQTQYEFQVQAGNVAGFGPWSESATFSTVPQNVYSISNCQELQSIEDDLDGIYNLTGNIDCSSVVDFQPIAVNSLFTGTLNGNGFKISNLTISYFKKYEKGDYYSQNVGLFGSLYGATIKNLTIVDSNFNASYELDEETDTDRNGLPDFPDFTAPELDPIDGVPKSSEEAAQVFQTRQQQVINALTDSWLSENVNVYGETAGGFPSISSGAITGVSLGLSNLQNVRTENTVVTGSVTGSLLGVYAPFVVNDPANSLSSTTGRGQIKLSNLSSVNGEVIGNISGGLIGIALSAGSNPSSDDGALVIEDSYTTSNVQSNIAGGIVGLGVSANVYKFFRNITGVDGVEVGTSPEYWSNLKDTLNSKTMIVKNSYTTGKVSTCDNINGFRVGSLGGIVGFGFGMSIESSNSSGEIKNCANTEDVWGIYGGVMGGLGGVLGFSEIKDSHSTSNVISVNDDVDEGSVLNSYIGVAGGLTGLFIGSGNQTNGGKVISNSYSTGNITAEGKKAFWGISGGLSGAFLGSGDIYKSYAKGNISHNYKDNSYGGVSIAGGMLGFGLGLDTKYIVDFAYAMNVTEGDDFNLPDTNQGLNINESYATGNVTTKRDGTGGHLALNGGLIGSYLGQGNISSSYATGNVNGTFINGIDVDNVQYVSDFLGTSKYGWSVTGGLIGSAWGIDFPRFITSVVNVAAVGGILEVPSSQGLIIENSHATGDVIGTVSGGLIGSADLKYKINKTYSEGNVDGAIVGGLIGETGTIKTAFEVVGTVVYTMTFDVDLDNETKDLIAEGSNQIISSFDSAEITNTYNTGNITAFPGKLDISKGMSESTDSNGNKLSLYAAPVKIPAVAGGVIGLNVNGGGKLSNSYASGNLTVSEEPDLSLEENDANYKIVYGKLPSFAGGIIGIQVTMPELDYVNGLKYTLDNDLGAPLVTDMFIQSGRPQELNNNFSVSNIKLNSETVTGGAIGLIASPLDIANKLQFDPNSDLAGEEVFKSSNNWIDKTKVTVANCSGPNGVLLDPVINTLEDTYVERSGQKYTAAQIPLVEEDEGSPIVGDLLTNEELENNHLAAATILVPFGFFLNKYKGLTTEDGDKINSTKVTSACQYVNENNSQPKYFINNTQNAPLNTWNFNNVWVARLNEYPKFTPGPLPPLPRDPTVDPPITDKPSADLYRVSSDIESILTNLGFDRQALGVHAVFEVSPSFMLKNLPISLIILLIILALLYSWQAYRAYRQLKKYYNLINRVNNTMSSVDDYLSITTHYINTPIAIMSGAIELLNSSKKVSEARSKLISEKIKNLKIAAAQLLKENEVSAVKEARANVDIPVDSEPILAKPVWVPAGIALGLLIIVNLMIVYSSVFSQNSVRLILEIGLYLLAVFLAALAYRYRNFIEQSQEIAREQLDLELDLYHKRADFLPKAALTLTNNYKEIEDASFTLKKLPEAKLFFNGLKMLAGIKSSLDNVDKFSVITEDTPLFDLSAYVRKSVEARKQSLISKEISLDDSISGGVVLRVEPKEAMHLVDSILDNAIKFSNNGGNIKVILTKRLNKIVLSISDNGVGIPDSKLPNLLKPFSRATDSKEYNYEGIGLALYTDKVIVNKLGGNIDISSRQGKGTTVTITLTLPSYKAVDEIAAVVIAPEAA